MNRKYRKELPKLSILPTERITGIYIIPDKKYDGFWGKNGYKSYDFIFEGQKKENDRYSFIKYGWLHWERRCY